MLFGIWVLILSNYFATLLCLQINNAAVNFNQGSDNSVEYASQVITTNYYGIKNMIQAMIPLMKHSAHGGRIVNVSSRLGRINGKRNVSEFVFLLSFIVIKIHPFMYAHECGGRGAWKVFMCFEMTSSLLFLGQ